MGTVYNVPVLQFTSTTNPSFSDLSNDALFCAIQTDYGKDGYLYLCASTTGVTAAFYIEKENGVNIGLVGITTASTAYNTLQIYTYNNNEYGAKSYSENQPNEPAIVLRSNMRVFSYVVEIDAYESEEEALEALGFSDKYPITYHYTNSTVSGPTEAVVGDTVTVSAVPDVGYGITDASTQILVTNDNVAVPYTWDAVNQSITFTMPQPATNRGGFGSTGQ